VFRKKSSIEKLIFNSQGNYEGKATFYSKSNPDELLGCINIAYTVA
jgi:hypothetical protein